MPNRYQPLSTCTFYCCTSVLSVGDLPQYYSPQSSIEDTTKKSKKSLKSRRKESRKAFKAESNAQILLREFIDFEQWQTYRRTNRIIVRPNKYFWIVGDIFGNYNKHRPFSGKPDVVRIDNPKKLYLTDFCVAQGGGESTPYTDKVMSFTLSLIDDEKAFVKTINRIGEKNFNKLKECALWDTIGLQLKTNPILNFKDKFEMLLSKIENKFL